MALPKWRKWVCTVSMDGFCSSLSSKVLNFLPTIWLINLILEFFGMFFSWNWPMCIWNVEAFSLLDVYVVFESYVLFSVNAVAIYKINSAIKGCEQTLIQHTCQGKSLPSLFSRTKIKMWASHSVSSKCFCISCPHYLCISDSYIKQFHWCGKV